MVIRTKSGKTPGVPAETPSEKQTRLAREQGAIDTANFEHLYGIGRELWPDDTKFEDFLSHISDIRKEKDY